ncbi:DUF5723 family protein [Balneola sp. MJW-20]|uniref:DUF5723 family protein n=1 Tax=Gracilimonas aurantiaca TaxID=3234185 RepID=UPI0034655489
MRKAENNIMKIVLLGIVSLFSVASMAQSRHYNSMTLGMGGGGTAYVDGFHANFINPANLAVNNYHNSTSIGLSGIGIKAGGTLAKIGVYNDYLTSGNVINGQLREDFIDDWFGSGNNTLDMNTTVNFVPIGFSHQTSRQAFSLAVRGRVTAESSINRGAAELYFYGLDSQQFGDPVSVNFSNDMVAFTEVSLGYARHIMTIPDLIIAEDVKLYAGIAPKLLMGFYAANARFNSTLQVGDQPGGFTVTNTFNYQLNTIGELSRQLQEYKRQNDLDDSVVLDDVVTYEGDDLGEIQATGFGVDLGATVEMDVSRWPVPLFVDAKKTLRVSMALTDLGSLNFDNDASRIFADGEFSYQGAVGQEDAGDFFDNLGDSLQNDVYGDFNTEGTDGIRYNLPGMYNFGASLEMGRLLAAVDYGFGFNNNGVNSRRSTLNLGLQYRLFRFLPLRVGMRSGGFSSAAYTAGFGLDFNFIEFSVAASATGNSSRNGGSNAVAWSGFIIRF